MFGLDQAFFLKSNKWKDGTSTLEPEKSLKEDDPHTLASYLQRSGLSSRSKRCQWANSAIYMEKRTGGGSNSDGAINLSSDEEAGDTTTRGAPRTRTDAGGCGDARFFVVRSFGTSCTLSSVGLEGADKERFNEIKMRLAELSTKFSNNVLDATKAFGMTTIGVWPLKYSGQISPSQMICFGSWDCILFGCNVYRRAPRRFHSAQHDKVGPRWLGVCCRDGRDGSGDSGTKVDGDIEDASGLLYNKAIVVPDDFLFIESGGIESFTADAGVVTFYIRLFCLSSGRGRWKKSINLC